MHKQSPPIIRPIKKEEADLIIYLLEKAGKTNQYKIPVEVSEMDDGGMGSLRLNHINESKFGKDLIQAQYFDSDGILVLVTLVENQVNELFELDMWKVDFSPLKQFPTPEQLKFES